MVTMDTVARFFVISISSLVQSAQCCRLELHKDIKANVTRKFNRLVITGHTVIRFHLKLHQNPDENITYIDGETSSQNTTLLQNKGPDTFAPHLWYWARGKGKYILRVPLDFHLMSLGVISFYIADMDILLTPSSADCIDEVEFPELVNMVTTILQEDVVYAENVVLSQDIICRSAYTMNYLHGRVVGVKGCEKNSVTGNYSCNSLTYMKGWEITWFGPMAVVALIYIFIILTIYKEYIMYKDFWHNSMQIQNKINMIGQKILRDVSRIRKQIYGKSVEENFIEFHQPVVMFDILGVSKMAQAKVTYFVHSMIILFLLGAHYAVFGYTLHYYSHKRHSKLIKLLETNGDLYVNVFGHLSWFYADESLTLQTYAFAEMILTALIPLLVLFLYVMFTQMKRSMTVDVDKKASTSAGQGSSIERGLQGVEVKYANVCHAFANSKVGIFISIIVGIIVGLFCMCIGGIYLIYSIYMLGIGLFLTLNLFAGWILPACLCAYYAYTVFNPMYEIYTTIKQHVFSECLKREYLIQTNEYMLVPTSLIEEFYQPLSKQRVFGCFQRVFFALGLLVMLFLVFIASQYPDFDITTKQSNLVMGVNIAIILPFLAGMVGPEALSDLEKEILLLDIKKHMDNWEKENEAMLQALKLRAQKLKTADKGEVAMETPALERGAEAGKSVTVTTDQKVEQISDSETQEKAVLLRAQKREAANTGEASEKSQPI